MAYSNLHLTALNYRRYCRQMDFSPLSYLGLCFRTDEKNTWDSKQPLFHGHGFSKSNLSVFVGVVFPMFLQGGTLTTPRIRRHATKKPCDWVRRRLAGPEMRRYGVKVSHPKAQRLWENLQRPTLRCILGRLSGLWQLMFF